MQELIADSIERKQCVERRWKRAIKKYSKENPEVEEEDAAVRLSDVQRWVSTQPTANEETHYAVIMDAQRGEIVWLRRWLEAIPDQQ
jgi:hypothetical protein